MSPEERDDEMLREYLEGDSALSRLYRRDAREQPDARLDARIRARARDAVARSRAVAHSPFARHWMVPTSLAAVFVLSVSVVLMMPEPAMEPDGEIDSEIHGAAKTAAFMPFRFVIHVVRLPYTFMRSRARVRLPGH